MATLVKTYAEVARYVRVSKPNNEILIPNTDRPASRFIVPVIGKTLFATLVQQYDGSSLTPANEKLLPKVQAALVPLAYWMDLATIHVQITDVGLRKMTSENATPIFKHDYNVLKLTLLEAGMSELESLIEFLESNAGDYPAWTSSDEYTAFRAFFIRSGREFNELYTLYLPRWSYLSLMPMMKSVEDFYIEKNIGGAFAKELKNLTAPTEDEKTAIGLAKKAIAHLTIKQAINSLTVRLTDVGFTVQAADPDIADSSRQSATDPQLERLRGDVELMGQSYLKDLREFLDKKASPTIFSTYYSSEFYTSPDFAPESLNENLRGAFFF